MGFFSLGRGGARVGRVELQNGAVLLDGAGAPTNGVTGAGYATKGSIYIRTGTGAIFANTGTKASPVWSQLGTVTALADAHILVGSGAGVATDVAMSGDISITNAGVTAIGAAKVTAAMLATAAEDGLGMLRVARATFNPTANAGERTVAAHGLGVTIPDKAIVVGGVMQVNALFTSAGGDTGTVAISVQSANDIVTAAAVSGAPYSSTGLKAITPKANTPETTGIALTAAREVTATVAVQALTAGKLTLNLYYMMGA